jgi:hypothetical protein
MHLTLIDLLRSGGATAVGAGVCGLALWRGLYKRFRLFTLYFGVLLGSEAIRWIPLLK